MTVNAIKLVMMLSLNILFVVYLRMGIREYLRAASSRAQWYRSECQGISSAGLVLGSPGRDSDRCWALASPLVPWWVGNFVLVFSDRFFLNHYTNTSTVGIYSLAYKFAFLLNALAYSPFDTIWSSARFEVAKRPDASEIYARVFFYMNVVLGGLGLVLCLFVRDFLSVMSDPAFLPAYRVVPLLIAAQVVFIWAAYWSVGIYVSGRTKVLATGAIVLVPLDADPQLRFHSAIWDVWRRLGDVRCLRRPLFLDLLLCAALLSDPISVGEYCKAVRHPRSCRDAGGFAYHPEHLLASIGWNTALLLTSIGLIRALVLSSNDRMALRSCFRRRCSGDDTSFSGKCPRL